MDDAPELRVISQHGDTVTAWALPSTNVPVVGSGKCGRVILQSGDVPKVFGPVERTSGVPGREEKREGNGKSWR
jgi:hypothetical protein